ncbi:MAG: hypothetical protein EBR30_26615 [Cytophagia bacterium]|nr:hypothetical protein [Cytophagia bacterium]
MSEISKQALKVDNNTSFPNNTTGYISPTILRAFNVNMIDSLVEQEGYNDDSSSWNVSIGALNTYTASFAPSLSSLNAFTASQLVVNSNLNLFTQSANASINRLDTFSSSFNAYTSSINQIRSNGVVLGTSTIFNLVGPGTFFSASLVQNIQGNIATLTFTSDNAKVNTSSFNDYTASTAATQSVFSASVATSFSASNATFTAFSASQNNFNLSATASLQELLNLSSSLSGGYATQGELDYSSSVLQANINTKADSASFNAFTASQFVSNSYFATTGSNTFIGIETLQDSGANTIALTPYSGSLMLVGKSYTSSSLDFITQSVPNSVNLLFKNNNGTAPILISGSNNIGALYSTTNPTGFIQYINSANYFNGDAAFFVSSSMTSLPQVNYNIFNAGTVTLRGPVSSSSSNFSANTINFTSVNLGAAANRFDRAIGGYTIQGNTFNILGNIAAGVNNISSSITISRNTFNGSYVLNISSSAINASQNYINSTGQLSNGYYSGSLGAGSLTFSRNIINGSTNNIIISGSLPAGATNTPQVAENMILGTNTIFFTNVAGADTSGTNAGHSIVSTLAVGHNITVSGSSAVASNNFGSAFIGRHNAIDANRAKTAQTIFAVGTGTSTSARKTGFLIDSGSNTFVEGSLSVSGSLSYTGSAYGNVVALSVASNTASLDLSVANYFTLTMPASATTNINVTNARPGVTATLVINTDTNSIATFSSNVKQVSGSAYQASPSGSTDIISLTAVNTSSVYIVPAYTFV